MCSVRSGGANRRDEWLRKTHVGDCRELLKRMAVDGVRVQTCVTSPPYFGLRDYGHPKQIGLEASPNEYIDTLVGVFRLVRELLCDDGTLWLNLGDSYASGGRKTRDPGESKLHPAYKGDSYKAGLRPNDPPGIKPKDLLGIPWRMAFALQADGWYLRTDIIEEVELYCPCGCGYVLEERIWRWSQDRDLIWKKPNPMPESVRDRPTKAHEYIFLLSKSQRYYFDADAIKEPAIYGVPNSPQSIRSPYGQGFTRRARTVGIGANARPSKAVPNDSRRNISPACASARGDRKQDGHGRRHAGFNERYFAKPAPLTRNRRSVWTVSTTPFRGAHFATFPKKLIEPCILAGSRPGDVVLEPFSGTGTVRHTALELGRRCIACEINPAYVELERLRYTTIGLSL